MSNEWEEYWNKAAEEEKAQLSGEDPVRNRFSLKEFVSNSGGRGRRRRAREVQLVVDLDSGRATTLHDIPTGGLDVVAQSLLGDLPAIDDAFVEFVRRLRL